MGSASKAERVEGVLRGTSSASGANDILCALGAQRVCFCCALHPTVAPHCTHCYLYAECRGRARNRVGLEAGSAHWRVQGWNAVVQRTHEALSLLWGVWAD